MINIREATEFDFEQIWTLFKQVVSLGDTYAYEPDTDKATAHSLWIYQVRKTYVAEENGEVLASYYIKTNQAGPGKHVCNCGYMVSARARGKGLATEMCKHSQMQAKKMGYLAMQFNFVAASNEGAVYLWLKLGFAEVGRLPNAFNHPKKGMVDALVMYKALA